MSNTPALKSRISDMQLDGYIRKKVEGHLEKWAVDVLDRNPSITGALLFAKNGGNPLNSPYGLGNMGQILEQNEFSGKYLTGLAFLYEALPTPELKVAGDRLVDELVQAQCDDGYLGVHEAGDRRGEKNDTWDVWGQYHMAYGLLQWYKATGEGKCLTMAVAVADGCLKQYSGKTYAVGSESVNYAIGHLYGTLYLETGKERFLAEAERIVREDWPKHGNWLNNALNGKELYQSDLPRWEVLHSVMTLSSLYEATGKREYLDALDDIWHSARDFDRHNTGGYTSGETAVGDPYAEGAIEFCACVAWVGFCVEYLRLTADAVAADELELTYYNSILCSLTDNLRYVSYNTPMKGTIVSSQESLRFLYSKGAPEFNCCQANSCRGIGEVSQWAALTGENRLYLNFYSPCAIHTKTPGGQDIVLHVTGEYPVNGNIGITVEGLKEEETFDLLLRIPSWCEKCDVTASQEHPVSGIIAGKYCTVSGTWKNGDHLSVTLDITVHTWIGKGNCDGLISVYRGPILLTADERFEKTVFDNLVLDSERLLPMEVVNGKDQDCWLIAALSDANNRQIRLIDFASAGKQKAGYFTWIKYKA